MRKQRGFTLVELMVVVAIIAILSALFVGMSSRTYGGNAQNMSQKIVSTLGWVRMRAVNTRKIQIVEVKPQEILIWQSSTPGFVASSALEFVQRVKIPTGVTIADVQAGAITSTGNSVTANAALDYNINFKPDGSSSGGTIFISDANGARPYRILTYTATGSSYARQTW